MTDGHAASAARRIDVTCLPPDVVAFIDALRPGEDLVVTQDGEQVAAISSTRGRPGEAAEPEPDYDNMTVVATAMKLSASARAVLSAELGTNYLVLDLHAAPRTAEVLLAPPASPQLIGNLRSMFPKARIIIAEIEDNHLGVSYEGPIRRLLDAGAETYLTSTTIPRLATQLDHTITQRHQITGGATARPAIEAPAEPPRPPE